MGTAHPDRYGWLGGKQRSTDATGGLVLMGVRLYAPQLGRFLQTDPVPGGNLNAYSYPLDPANEYDLDGKRRKRWRDYRFASRILGRAAWFYARMHGGRCKYRYGMRTCRMSGRFYPRGGITIGETYITGWGDSRQISRGRIQHEKNHRKQWRIYGWRFSFRYAFAGRNPCRNRWEREAGYKNGGYTRCLKRRR
ncbi:RHS repeat-associated core domain-containing protein [Tenggerimyces flavus]|uniref:RHS repeat-associated core domain-containing protein n=1 Tax=Tenggerimyces flavus TaxID=1708749 RepID=UPI0027DA6578|nr:RHS repeat-associated core domain-containing protein [Tenggerimyces flavus]